MTDDFENKLAGCIMALFCALGREAAERVSDALLTFAADCGTPLSEARFYRDLASSIGELPAVAADAFDIDQLVTLH